MRRTIAAIAAAVAIAVTAAPAAHADTVGVDGNGTLVVTAGPEQNRVGLQPSPLEDGRLVIYDGVSGQVTSATSACEQWGAEAVMCNWNPSVGVHVDLGDGNDDGYVSFGIAADAAIVFAGGAGNDTAEPTGSRATGATPPTSPNRSPSASRWPAGRTTDAPASPTTSTASRRSSPTSRLTWSAATRPSTWRSSRSWPPRR